FDLCRRNIVIEARHAPRNLVNRMPARAEACDFGRGLVQIEPCLGIEEQTPSGFAVDAKAGLVLEPWPGRSGADGGREYAVQHPPQDIRLLDQRPYAVCLLLIGRGIPDHEFDGLLGIETGSRDTRLEV